MDEARRPPGGPPGTSLGLRGELPSGRTGLTWPPAQPFTLVLASARQHDARALSLLYHRFLPVVYRYVLGRVADTHAAEDITSETFLAMIHGMAGTRAEDELSFASWLLGIARNQVATHFRRHIRSPMPLDVGDDVQPAYRLDEGDPLTILTARESWHEVVAALNRLSEEQRTVILYRCVLDYSAEEVGQLLGKQAGAIRVQQFRALSTLARLLGTARGTSEPVKKGSGSHARRR